MWTAWQAAVPDNHYSYSYSYTHNDYRSADNDDHCPADYHYDHHDASASAPWGV